MNTLNLSHEEQELLVRVLKRSLADLDHEIIHTHHGEFKQMLRERRAILDGIIRKLPDSVDEPASSAGQR